MMMRRVEFLPTGSEFPVLGYMSKGGSIHDVRSARGGYATLYTDPHFFGTVFGMGGVVVGTWREAIA